MTKREIEVIEHVNAIVEYCKSHGSCGEHCIFHSSDRFHEDICTFDMTPPCDWEPPEIKTYKEDFMEKFPNAKFEADSICRNCVYPNAGKHPNCNLCGSCEECWNEVCMEK